MTRRSILATAAATLVMLVGVGFVVFQEHARNDLTVVNQSGVAIRSLEIALPWETLHFEQVANGESATKSFTIKYDAHFEVNGQLVDGTAVRASDGYITNGQYGEAVRVEVGRNGIVKLTQGQRAT